MEGGHKSEMSIKKVNKQNSFVLSTIFRYLLGSAIFKKGHILRSADFCMPLGFQIGMCQTETETQREREMERERKRDIYIERERTRLIDGLIKGHFECIITHR